MRAADQPLELCDGGLQRAGLRGQFLGGGGGLFGAGGVGLRHLVHLADGAVELADALALFLRGLRDLRDNGVDLPGFLDDIDEHLPDGTGDRDAMLAFADGVFDFGGGLFGGLRGTLG